MRNLFLWDIIAMVLITSFFLSNHYFSPKTASSKKILSFTEGSFKEMKRVYFSGEVLRILWGNVTMEDLDKTFCQNSINSCRWIVQLKGGKGFRIEKGPVLNFYSSSIEKINLYNESLLLIVEKGVGKP